MSDLANITVINLAILCTPQWYNHDFSNHALYRLDLVSVKRDLWDRVSNEILRVGPKPIVMCLARRSSQDQHSETSYGWVSTTFVLLVTLLGLILLFKDRNGPSRMNKRWLSHGNNTLLRRLLIMSPQLQIELICDFAKNKDREQIVKESRA